MATLRKIKRRGGDLWRAYALKEALRAIFAGDLSEEEVGVLLDWFCSRAQRSAMKPFVSLSARRVSDISLFRRLPVLDLIGDAQRKLFEFTD